MVAFVLGAGLGTRLRPLTEVRPKPLIPVGNRPLIEYAFDHLEQLGVERYVVNTHWLAHVYAELFPANEYRGRPIAFRHEPAILETAGGIKNVEDLLGDEPFVVYNGDILTDLPLAPLLEAHRRGGHEVTMALRSKDGPLQVALDESSGAVADISSRLGSLFPPKFLFTGVYCVEPSFVRRIPPATKISVIPLFLNLIRAGGRLLGGVVIDEGHWWDLGSRAQYLAVHRHFAAAAPWLDPAAEIAGDAQITGATAIGAGARIRAGARLHDTLVWPGAEIASGAELSDCIVTGRQVARGTLANLDL